MKTQVYYILYDKSRRLVHGAGFFEDKEIATVYAQGTGCPYYPIYCSLLLLCKLTWSPET